ncbi:ABC transporter permease [Desulfogranum marinum]|uniref:ABC transporter permease n=1 Tax=Desulfogranum marinum TaxID=453220 RepID=UPI001963BBB5|nr:FtsX-like permease family protein [Desulfogranum marinum]MBM9514879.1 FtsX-like permease family protein [Desulfogranum marinum]
MIAKLAAKDIMHEWLLSLCLVMAISSIIAPLLLLFGLKYGSIQTLRGRLIQDPKNREIRPLTSKSYSHDWFKKIQNSKGVSFIVPMTRQISSTIEASSSLNNTSRVSLLATAEGDPLLVENGAKIPDKDSCVLSQNAASELNVRIGEKVTLTVRRNLHGKSEKGNFTLLVTGILDARATSVNSIFVQLSALESVEDFKDGRAVPRYGWQGVMPEAYPVYDGVIVLTPILLSKLEETLLVNNTGFTKVKSLPPSELLSITGYKIRDNWSAYLISVQKRAAENESVDAVRHRLRGKNAIVLRYTKSISAKLTTVDGLKSELIDLLAVDAENLQSNDTHLQFGLLPNLRLDSHSRLLIIPKEINIPEGKAVLNINGQSTSTVLPVKVVHGIQSNGKAYVNATLAGMLNLMNYRTVQYNEKIDKLLLSRRGYAGFRMYAETIDHVESIQQSLEEKGITVRTAAERIIEVRQLDSYLTLIFWLIAVVGIIGGVSALTASLYASVERKKKELNILRLIGMFKLEIVRFPLYQGLLLSGSGIILAISFFVIISGVINTLFRSHLSADESLCTLTTGQLIFLTSGVLLLSAVASVFAALHATKMDPAEALRDE